MAIVNPARLRAIWATRNRNTRRLRAGVRSMVNRQAYQDQMTVAHLRGIANRAGRGRDLNQLLIHSDRFSNRGRRRIVARQIREMRKKYGSTGARSMIKSMRRFE